MRIIIAGAGNVGTYLIKMFTENNHDVTIIDSDKEKLQELSAHYDVKTVFGTTTSIDVLEEAKASKCDLFICVSNFQETNLLACTIAKKLGVTQTIARVDNEEYIQKENEQMLKSLGVDYLVYPEIFVSDEIVNHLRFPSILKSINFASGELFLFSFKNMFREELNNKYLKDVTKEFPNLKARIVAISRQDNTIIPRGTDIIMPDDIIYIITDKEGRVAIQDELGISSYDVKNVMILGGSRIGVRLAKTLEKFCYVKLFEKSREKSYSIANELEDTLVIHSEARDAEFLLDEGIRHTDAFIAVTGNSEINMLSCMLAKKLGVKKTYAEVENTDYLELLQKVDIDYVINKKFTAASKIFTHTMDAKVLSMNFFTDIDAQVIEFVVGNKAKVTEKPLKDLDFPQKSIIGGIVRDGVTYIAVGDTHLRENDRVVVFCLPGVVDKVAKWFK